MNITQSEINGSTILFLSGEVDVNSSPALREALAKLMNKGIVKIVINFEKVSYIDSSGLATFIEIMQRLKKKDGQLSLVQMSDKIRNLFEITKLNKLFTIYETQEQALAS